MKDSLSEDDIFAYFLSYENEVKNALQTHDIYNITFLKKEVSWE